MKVELVNLDGLWGLAIAVDLQDKAVHLAFLNWAVIVYFGR